MRWTAREPHFEQIKGRDRGCIGGAFCFSSSLSQHVVIDVLEESDDVDDDKHRDNQCSPDQMAEIWMRVIHPFA